ncbi:cyclin [Plasmodium brasilianum]|uniref:Cyclin, putative n=2 Tax=Plasmodium (Plasmodium) TaxID=418103 RepID=A0A1D3TDY7_PLAMA|nr:cyclin, putative [Plasmodium malariae]KAI4834620.1 cyclin [Plasmodium brasilianum]SCP03160.1 cyclin, putative [Plasmodium malariae]
MINDIILINTENVKTPSEEKNVTKSDELKLRIYGCQLLQEAGIILKLKAVTIATGQVLFHRFYFKKSLTDYDVKIIAPASLYLSCKLEENFCRVYKIISTFYFLYKYEDLKSKHYYFDLKNIKLEHFKIDIESQEYKNMKVDIYTYELLILKEIGFLVHKIIQHPHLFLLPYIHSLFNNLNKFDGDITKKLAQIAWGFLNDSMRTTLCCEYQPRCIAVASIFLASYKLNIPLIKSTNWFKLFDVEYDDIKRICIRILQLYKIGRCQYIDVLTKK